VARDTDAAFDAVQARLWADAYDAFEAADNAAPLSADALEAFAVVAQLLGRDEQGSSLLERAHRIYQQGVDARGQARTAFWLAFSYMDRGEPAQAGGWLARAHRVLDAAALECPERGYVLLPEALASLDAGDGMKALETFGQIAAIGEQFDDRDLATLRRLGSGQALIQLGEPVRGTALLDEAMVAVVAGELSPIVVGIVYCATIEACQQMFDLARAQEWTDALYRWCEAQPDMVPFRGRCLIYRAEILQRRGEWADAGAEVERARQRLADPPHPAIGAAYYRQAEIQRVLGLHDEAERSFRASTERGQSPYPGLALLRLAQGRIDVALKAITNALGETVTESARVPLLAAATEIAAAANEPDRSIAAARDLAQIAYTYDTPLVSATSAHATGLAKLARREAAEAMRSLEEALALWLTLPAPYEAARTRALIAQSAGLLEDQERADAETREARATFKALGAADDLRLLDLAASGTSTPAGLTPRELKVLNLVATGMTNRAIAHQLTISEKTVARHLSNIFGKLGVTSRAAATAYAYRNDLV